MAEECALKQTLQHDSGTSQDLYLQQCKIDWLRKLLSPADALWCLLIWSTQCETIVRRRILWSQEEPS